MYNLCVRDEIFNKIYDFVSRADDRSRRPAEVATNAQKRSEVCHPYNYRWSSNADNEMDSQRSAADAQCPAVSRRHADHQRTDYQRR